MELRLLLCVLSVASVRGIIWGPALERVDEGTSVLEVDPDEMQSSDSMSRLVRRSADDVGSVGHVVPLPGDSHYLAVVHWTGHPSQNIFILTRDLRGFPRTNTAWLWRSKDFGVTFVNETSKWDNDTFIDWYYISPDLSKLIFVDIVHTTLWVTTDEGESYSKYPVLFAPNKLLFQSVNSPASNEVAQSELVLGYEVSSRALWVSTDLGSTWTHLANNVTENRYFWRVMNSSVENLSTVYYEKAVNATHCRVYNASSPYRESDRVPYPGLPLISCNSLYVSDEYMFVQISNEGNTVEYSSPLWVSRFRGPFQQARFPLQDLAEEHYGVVDTSEGQVFMGVYHDINNTNLYMSEPAGLVYSLSLEHVISPPVSEWKDGRAKFDVHVVEGVIGTYFVNVHTPNATTGLTVVTYDKGGDWIPLIPPYPQLLTCQPPACSLHLHIASTRYFQSILTKKSAIGVILAQGNIGASLSDIQGDNGLYTSLDGGFTWALIDTGFKHFQFAGLGSVVVWVDYRRSASSLDWSCNEGLNSQKLSFLYNSTLESIYVVGMLAERGETARRATLFGYSRQWYVIDLDFRSVVNQECQDDDFVTWIPSDERRGGRCLLGEHIEYERRNSSVCCYQNPNKDLVVTRTPCSCVREDFECDFGFERLNLDSPCVVSDGFKWPPLQPEDCPAHTYYTISSGYRKIAGDRCVPGLDNYFFPTSHPCLVVSDAVQLVSSSSVPIASGNFVPVNSDVSFRVTRAPDSDLVFPDVLTLTWYTVPPKHAPCQGRTTVMDVVSHTNNVSFPCWGGYDITVQGNISNHAFVLKTRFNAENILGSAEVQQTSIPSVLRSGGSLRLDLLAHQVSGVNFEGPLMVTIVDFNDSVLVSKVVMAPDDTSVQLQVMRDSYSEATKIINITLANNLSSTAVHQRLTLAVKGQYAELRLRLHNIDLSGSSDYAKISGAVSATLYSVVHQVVPNAYVEIESVSLPPPVAVNRKRQLPEVWVEVNILPASLQKSDIDAVMNVSAGLVQSRSLIIVIDGRAINASISNRDDEIIIEVTQKIYNRTLYIGLGAGLGTLLVVIVAIAIVMAVVIYFYRRKYQRLNVRYSRLRQTPVRFTFTQGGEMMEEDDYEGDDDKVEVLGDN